MRSTPALIFVLTIALLCNGCDKNEPDPEQQPVDVEDISTSAEITPYGGELQATDESGNVVTVTFPPGALTDTTTVTLTILGKHRDLPIEERQIRAFEIKPGDLILYEPVTISVDYQASTDGIEGTAIFRLRSDELLVPLSDHVYPGGNTTVKATTMFPGTFAEGKMTTDQINSQIERLESSMGITLKSTGTSSGNTNIFSSGCEIYKAAWDDWTETAGGFLELFRMRELTGYYNDLDPGERTFQEDCDRVCSEIIEKGVNDVLDLGEHDDPCCREYAQTVESMMKAVIQCGIETATLDRMNDRYDRVHDQCHTYLDITVEVNIESQKLLIMSSGEVMITLEGTGDGEAAVTGNGELTVAGSGNAGGVCSSTISGQNFVSVSGTRDAAYIYTLTLNFSQVAMMVTVCPDFASQTPLVGESAKEVTLGPGNGFSLSETETIDEGITVTQIFINNPYIYVPQPE